MDNKILQSFLDAGLFEIGDNDERLKNLNSAVTDLAKNLEENMILFPAHVLVAMDPNIPESDPVIQKVEEIIKTHWKTLRSKYNDTPRTIIRSVILGALCELGLKDSLYARIISLTATNFHPFAKLDREKPVIDEFLNELINIAEESAAEEWSLVEEEPKLKLPTLKISGLKLGTVELQKDDLKPGLRTAINNDPTGHGSQHGGNSSWGGHFSEESSKAITAFINDGFKNIGAALNPAMIEEPVNKFFTEFKKSLDSALKTSFKSIIAIERRSKLLWWKETFYSPSLKTSYRNIEPAMLPVIMASDLYQQLPEITPASVDFLLKDTLFLLLDKKDESTEISAILGELLQHKSTLKTYFEEPAIEGRITITDFVAGLFYEKVNIDDLYGKTGISGKELVTRREISTAMLHDLLTYCLITE